MKRVLLIGATGTFGSRLARHLAAMPELHLHLASRSKRRAQALLERLGPCKAMLSPVALHVGRDLNQVLHEIAPWLVIDASGPFQFANYDVPRAALEAQAHYLDLADAQDFLIGFASDLDGLAQKQGLVARAGCSTTPALTTAVVDHLTQGWQRVDTVDVTIIPGGSNTVGPAIAAAVLSQAGVPITQFRHGRYGQFHGWLDAQRVTIPRLGTFRAVLAETVDPMVMPERYGLTSRMTFRAGLVSQIEQRGFEIVARLRRTGVFKRVDMLAPLLARGRKLTRLWSDDRGGMAISVTGVNAQGCWTSVQWSLLAEKGNGPHVPILPLLAAIKMLLAGRFSAGARSVEGDIALPLIAEAFPALSISTHINVTELKVGAFEQVLGKAASADLPMAVRQFHEPNAYPVWHGEADVERGRSILARIVGRIIGLPPAGGARKVEVSVERDAEGGELWTRTFAGKSFCSRMRLGRNGTLHEAFGPLEFHLGLAASQQGTDLPVVSGRAFGIPIPRFLLPVSMAREHVDGAGRFCFDVRIELPFVGLLAHYRGWLVPKTEQEIVHHDQDSGLVAA